MELIQKKNQKSKIYNSFIAVNHPLYNPRESLHSSKAYLKSTTLSLRHHTTHQHRHQHNAVRPSPHPILSPSFINLIIDHVLYRYIVDPPEFRLTAQTLALEHGSKNEYNPLEEWVMNPERHEQLAVNKYTNRAQRGTEAPGKKKKKNQEKNQRKH